MIVDKDGSYFFFSSRRRHTRFDCDWSSDVCSSDLIDEATSPWGIKVTIVEVKDVEIPSGMQRAMARQAEAERERRAKVIAAEGEFQASERLKDAAQVLAQNPMSLQLRYLQTMLEMSSERTSTLILPLPIELIGPLVARARGQDDA